MKRKLLCWILIIAALLPMLSGLTVSAADEDAKWIFFEDTGLLYIYGAESLYRREYNSRYKWDKEAVKSLIVEEGVQEIGTGFFGDHTLLKEVYLPESLKIIGYGAFGGCDSLEEIRIPNGVHTISHSAFVGCDNLKKIELPSALKSLGKNAFSGCLSLKRISLPSGVTKIEEGTFQSCTSLESITLPDGVTSIGMSAFAYCSSLQQVVLPAALTTIEPIAFRNCEKLRGFTLSPENTNFIVRDGVLYSTDGKRLVLVPSGHVGTFVIPNGVEAVAPFAGAGATMITELQIPSTVKNFEDGAFILCSRLLTLDLPQSVQALYSGSFRDVRCVRVRNKNCTLANGTNLFVGSERWYGWGTAVGMGETCAVYGESGSYAESYAKQFSCKFYSLSEWENRVEPAYEPLPDWALEELPPVAPDEPYVPAEPVERPSLPDEFYMVFRDVHKTDWYYHAVLFAVKNGLFNGTDQNTFSPEEPMTRAMLVTVLWRYAGAPLGGNSPFVDVSDDVWYTDAVVWASEMGVVNGVGGGRFDPNGLVTREQLATILYRYSAMQEMDVSARAELDRFPDGDQVSAYAADAFSWAVAEGLINGNQSGGQIYLQPKGSATRAQVAAILMRYIQNLSK